METTICASSQQYQVVGNTGLLYKLQSLLYSVHNVTLKGKKERESEKKGRSGKARNDDDPHVPVQRRALCLC